MKKQGNIALEVNSEIIKGPRGLSIQSMRYKETLSNGDNIYEVIREDNAILGEITVKKGAQGIQGIQGKIGRGITEIKKIEKIGKTNNWEIRYTDETSDYISVQDGDSAFEVAVENGFTWEWTGEGDEPEDYGEKEWLKNLIGPAGDKGDQGEQGIGISNIVFKEDLPNGDKVYTITLENSNNYDFISPMGPKGEVPDLSEKMDKYQMRYDIRDYDDLITDGFYILTGSASSSPSINAPYGDSALVQVWSHGEYIYQNAVSYYNVELQFTRCFQKGRKNTKWERIVNTASYSLICPYSIGDIMFTASNQNPAVKWLGTTWAKIEGRFLFGTGSGYNLGVTGGAANIALNVANIPSHNHSATQSVHAHTQPAHSHIITSYEGGGKPGVSNYNSGYNALGTQATSGAGGDNTGSAQPTVTVGYTGSGSAFSIMPPYLVVNIWKRLS